MKLNFSFSLRGPDRVSEELATVLSKKGSWEFKALFDIIHASLRSKDQARGGEEMLRLRSYEKLQNFLSAGIVTKKGKEYSGAPKALAAFFKTSAEFNARFASGTHTFTPSRVKDSGASQPVTKSEVPKKNKTQLALPKGKKPALKKAAERRKVAVQVR